MIVPMKKVTLLCLTTDRHAALNRLQQLGVLHLVPVTPPEGEDLDEARANRALIESATRALRHHADSLDPEQLGPRSDAGAPAAEIAKQAHDAVSAKSKLQERLLALEDERLNIQPFGDFDPARVAALAEAGISIKLYCSSTKHPVSFPEGVSVVSLSDTSTGKYFAAIGREDFDIEAEERPLPRCSLSDLDSEIDSTKREIAETDDRSSRLAGCIGSLERRTREITDRISYLEAATGMGGAGALSDLSGFCPEDLVHALQAAARANGWGLVLEEPGTDDAPPTLVRYPAWVRAIQPVFRFLGILPGYREADISSAFFVFLSFFFAMIVGDAGYGLLFLILLPYLRAKKFPDAPAEPFRLLYVFSFATLLWGVLTANYFGIEYELLPSFLKSLRANALIGQNNSMTFSLLLGAIHLTLAHSWNTLRFGRSARSLVQLGWIGVVWAVFCVARQLLVGAPFPGWFVPIAIVAALAIPVGLVGTKEWMGLGLLPLDLVSCFGDLMSYLRLFALGIASVKVADAFNGMAADLGVMLAGMAQGPASVVIATVLAGAAMAVVLVFGHGLNIVLCAMSVLVHGVRLNALEFSMHMGQEWTGYEYRPFAVGAAAGTGHTV